MRIAALYIEDHDLEEGGYTVNLGGFNHYHVKVADSVCEITAKANDTYVNDLFDNSGTVTNVSAIVGNNGSGKTTLIYELINLLNENYVSGITIWEDRDGIGYIDNYSLRVKIRISGFVLKQFKKEKGTIYYSPYLDHKSGVSGIDISADRYLREDLINIDSTYDANNKVVISERLKRADYKRYIKLQKSKYAEKIIQEYGLLSDDLYRVVFIRHEIKTKDNGVPDFDNTPSDFTEFLARLFRDIQKEHEIINRGVSDDGERFQLQKDLFKNLILMDLLCLLIRLMEKKNMYLKDGHFIDIKEAQEILNSDNSAENKLKYWLNNYYFSKGVKKPLPHKEIINVLNYLYDYLDNLTYSKDSFLYMDWDKKAIYFDEKKLFELLDLNENLMAALPKYYLATEYDDQNVYDSISELQHFISPEFADRRLSSGETAMLNLYSRLYDYFSRHILDVQIIKKYRYYLIFLDEADLGYHPVWKRSFVNTVINFSKDFFKELGAQIQIVFTTHDALSLSDIPNTNVVYLHSSSPNRILNNENELRPKTTFAANVNDLLGHSFFLDDLLVGDFANSKIEQVIDWININQDTNGDFNRDEFNDVKEIISLIEEPVLRNKLAEMLGDIEVDEKFIGRIIQKQSDYLRDILKRTKN